MTLNEIEALYADALRWRSVLELLEREVDMDSEKVRVNPEWVSRPALAAVGVEVVLCAADDDRAVIDAREGLARPESWSRRMDIVAVEVPDYP